MNNPYQEIRGVALSSILKAQINSIEIRTTSLTGLMNPFSTKKSPLRGSILYGPMISQSPKQTNVCGDFQSPVSSSFSFDRNQDYAPRRFDEFFFKSPLEGDLGGFGPKKARMQVCGLSFYRKMLFSIRVQQKNGDFLHH